MAESFAPGRTSVKEEKLGSALQGVGAARAARRKAARPEGLVYDGIVGRRKITTTVYLEPEQDDLLKALSERTNVPVAAYIRRGVDLVLEAHRGVIPGQLTLFDARALSSRPKRALSSRPRAKGRGRAKPR